LGAKEFVAGVLATNAAVLHVFLPVIVFLIAVFLAFATGTSWGTFGILLPIVVPILDPTSELLIIAVAATLAGAVCGDHCSPISDTTIMASTGAQCDHINHVSTQLPYAFTVAAVSAVNYILAALIQNWMINLPIAILSMVGTILVIKNIYDAKEKRA
jgi:Na+/H+ antiporter NhaC